MTELKIFLHVEMNNLEKEIDQINKLIAEKEEGFQKALSNNAESSLLTYIKKDIDFFCDKRTELYLKLKSVRSNQQSSSHE